MNQESEFPLVPRAPRALEKGSPGARRILSGMVLDALALKREPFALAAKRFRIGDYEWCDPDYRQIKLWAEALGMEPKIVIERLLVSPPNALYERLCLPAWAETRIENGSFTALFWNHDLLPIKEFEFLDGIRIQSIFFLGRWELGPPEKPKFTINHIKGMPKEIQYLGCQEMDVGELGLSTAVNLTDLMFSDNRWTNQLGVLNLSDLPRLSLVDCSDNSLTRLNLFRVPRLRSLKCSSNQLSKLDLSGISNLASLECSSNRLTTLDLSGVPELTSLECSRNQLTKLDLSGVPELTSLGCLRNQLTKLDLSGVANFAWLRCSVNRITKLDLSRVPQLISLECSSNQLTNLDISCVPKLTSLECSNNQLTKLDLSRVPDLTSLACSSNQLTNLDISCVPKLTSLRCSNNQLTKLELSHVPQLTRLICDDNPLTGLDLSHVPMLTQLWCNDIPELDIRPLYSLKSFFYGASTRLIQRPDQKF